MLEEIRNIKSEKVDLRNFGITIGIILIIITGFLFWKEKQSFQIFFSIGTVLLMFGLFIPVILKPIYWLWMIFATILGWVMTRVILSVLFYVIITPLGLITRVLFGKQLLELNWRKNDSTYWNYHSKTIFENKNYEKQY